MDRSVDSYRARDSHQANERGRPLRCGAVTPTGLTAAHDLRRATGKWGTASLTWKQDSVYATEPPYKLGVSNEKMYGGHKPYIRRLTHRKLAINCCGDWTELFLLNVVVKIEIHKENTGIYKSIPCCCCLLWSKVFCKFMSYIAGGNTIVAPWNSRL